MGKFLITGGCGFIGSHLVEGLLNKGHSLIILDDLSTGKKINVPVEVPLFIGSINNSLKIKEAIESVDGVFHLAAVSSVEKSTKEWVISHSINLTGTLQIFEMIARMKQKIPVIYASSAAVYGTSTDFPLSEKSPTLPTSPYGIDKLACEMHAKVAWELHQIPSIGFRMFNVFGPKQNADSSYSGVITQFVKRAKEEFPLKIYGDGTQSRDFIAIEDVVKFFIRAMEKHFEGANVYNLCTGRSTSINELVLLLEKIFKKTFTKEYAPIRRGEIIHSRGDPTKVEKEFEIKACSNLAERLEALVQGEIYA